MCIRDSPSSFAPQPHWKNTTRTPNEAPAASRFITAAVAGTSRLRNAACSCRRPPPLRRSPAPLEEHREDPQRGSGGQQVHHGGGRRHEQAADPSLLVPATAA